MATAFVIDNSLIRIITVSCLLEVLKVPAYAYEQA
jgi:hypothetical protein